jgi:hypothetical protein
MVTMLRTLLMAVTLTGIVAQQTVVWGAAHVELEITDSGGRIDFDCAHGTIDEPVRPDSQGAFKAAGTFSPERGGPTRDGDGSHATKVTYVGTINGDTMTLRVVVPDETQPGTTYQLARGQRGNVRKCR